MVKKKTVQEKNTKPQLEPQTEGKTMDTSLEESENFDESQNSQEKDNQPNGKCLIQEVAKVFDEESQVVQTDYEIGGEQFSIFYIESLIDKKSFSSGILQPIEKLKKQEQSLGGAGKDQGERQSGQENVENKNQNQTQERASDNTERQGNTQPLESIKEILKAEFLSVSSIEESTEAEDIIDNILSGQVEIVFEDGALDCPIFGAEKRSIEEPPNSKVVKGPREGFVEDIFTNIGLVRKRMKTPDLKIVDEFVGTRSNTHVSIFYIKDVAKPEVVQKVRQKIKEINIDAIIDSYYIESFIEENHLKFFRRVGNTEKPDIFCAKILEGRVGILVDGSPVALTVPFVLFEDLQSAEDYYTIPTMAAFTRIMRFIGLIFAILVPGVYVALQSYNYRILPINFLITLLSSIEGLSFPPLIEILIVLFLFEVITEASVRMPSALGMALSIIGALALGNTAVDAGIISPPSIVIVAISSVALYIIPDQIAETRILRVLFTVIGGIIGLYGVVVSLLILTTFLCSIESFGVPYMSPIAPSVKKDKKDAFIKQPLQAMKNRPVFFAGKDKIRQEDKDNDK